MDTGVWSWAELIVDLQGNRRCEASRHCSARRAVLTGSVSRAGAGAAGRDGTESGLRWSRRRPKAAPQRSRGGRAEGVSPLG